MKKRTIGVVITVCLATILLAGVAHLAYSEFHSANARKQVTEVLNEAAQTVMSDTYIKELTEAVESEREIERTRPSSKIWLLQAIQKFDSEESLVAEYTSLLDLLWGKDWSYAIKAFELDDSNMPQFMLEMLEYELSSTECSIHDRAIWQQLDDSRDRAQALGWIWFGQNEKRLDSILNDREMMALYRLTSNSTLVKNDDQTAQKVAQQLGGQDANIIICALIERGLLPESSRPALKDPTQGTVVPRNDTGGPGPAYQTA